MRTAVLQTLSEHGANFSTLASQMRRLVSCRAGCFLSFTQDVAGARSVVLMRSRDDGRSFDPFDQIPAGANNYRPAALATDGESAVFAAMPAIGALDTVDGWAWFLHRYDADGDTVRAAYRRNMGQGGSNNITLMHDARRDLLHYCNIVGSTSKRKRRNWVSVDPRKGRMVRRTALTTLPDGRDGFHYPHLATHNGVLFLAWTSWEQQRAIYGGIGVARSEDGGAHWTTLEGAPLTLPFDGGPAGPAGSLLAEEERGLSAPLAAFTVHGGALHFYYSAMAQPQWRQTYLRYDLVSRQWHRTNPRWGGSELEINGLDGAFVSVGDRLLAIGNRSGNALAVLASDDSGRSWFDFGIVPMPEGFIPYGVHACLAPGNVLLCLFTASPAVQSGPSKVMCFRMELDA
jgi:hypothetical protein